ncbi:MAG: ATP-grasp domain-containing protein [Candidatus Accumulibacter sp.]|nr:ATP-grasp domain-containing protein [Accumulibacter sp.]
MTTVLVSGVGAIMGYGLLRSLRAARPEVRLVGTDIYPDAVGQAWCDVFEKAPLTASPGYLDWLLDLIARQQIDLLIPGIEQDVHRLSDDRPMLAGSRCRLAINNRSLIDLSRDKWAMHQALLDLGDSSRIPSHLSGDFASLSARLGLPFILKPRRSYASKGLLRVLDEVDFAQHGKALGEHLMAQPLVGTDDEEFTVGIFGDGNGRVCASISMQRRLASDGSTAKAWVRSHASLDDTVKRLCAHFRPLGPTNLQFRRDGADWKLLEINPRVSSTTSIRTAFGYNEALMSLDFFLDGKLPVQPVIGKGFAVRFIEDHVVHDRDHF